MKFYTIGVYGKTEEDFFTALYNKKIDLFCDIRQRRGVRGKKYSFVNSLKLQKKLEELNIEYLHIKKLAPTKEIREAQKEEDNRRNILKKDRLQLGEKFITEYNKQIIKLFDFEELFEYFKKNNFKKISFFCVEEKAEACHRSLVANKIIEIYNQEIEDL